MAIRLIAEFFFGVVVSFLLGKGVLPTLRRLKAGQSIREEGPESHFVKGGTPTMGGVMFILSTLIGSMVFTLLGLRQVLILISMAGFGAIGFFDDYIKVVKKRNLGLRAWQKLALQIGMACLLIYFAMTHPQLSDDVIVPGWGKPVSLGWLYVPFAIFVVVGTVNSVNLTDGLDGLSSGVSIVVLLFLGTLAYLFGAGDVLPLCLLLAGGLVGFLYYNHYPAKVFMGDMGSLALGGFVAAAALLSRLSLFLPFLGGIYFAETLSVILQVASFKLRHKRIFLMSPLHHHFELKGWKETKVVSRFVGTSVVLGLLGLLLSRTLL